jgi:MFS family permease
MALLTVVRRGVSSGKHIGLESVAASNSGVKPRVGAFVNLSVVGVLDDAVRASALTFVPFLMRDKGMSIEQVFGMLFLLLAGGAIGKLVCGWLDDRYGSVRLIWGTKGLTAALLLAAIAAPPVAMAPLVVLLGIGLNGTSSVLYGTVARFVPPHLRPRYYGYFYTAIQAGSTFAPLLYGILADLLNIGATIATIAFAAGLILPVSLLLRRHLVEDAALPAPSPR